MRNSTFIIIVALFAIAIAGYFIYDKKNKIYQPDVTPPDPLPQPTATQANQNIVDLQNWLNGFDETQPKLVVDGIFGKNTKAAFDKINSFKQNDQLNDTDQNDFLKFQSTLDNVFGKTAMALTLPGMYYNATKGVSAAADYVIGLFN